MDVSVDWVEYQEWLAREREAARWQVPRSWTNPLLPREPGLYRRPMSPSEYVFRYYIGKRFESLWKMPDDPFGYSFGSVDDPWYHPDLRGFRWDVEVFCEQVRQLQADAAAAWARRPAIRIDWWSGLLRRDADAVARTQRLFANAVLSLREKGVL
jgi:hypothetical protein